jgi:hypothetical protein
MADVRFHPPLQAPLVVWYLHRSTDLFSVHPSSYSHPIYLPRPYLQLTNTQVHDPPPRSYTYKPPHHQDSGFTSEPEPESECVDSGAGVDPTDPTNSTDPSYTPTPAPAAVPASEQTFLLPLASSRRRIRQTVPVWVGVLVVVGVFAWAGVCAVYVSRVSGR